MAETRKHRSANEPCARTIASIAFEESTDPGQRTLFSLSGYKGSKPLLVKFEGNQFKLWKRRYYRNDFSPYFYGTLSPENQGTRIQGYFDIDRWMKIFMRIWLAGVVRVHLAGVSCHSPSDRSRRCLGGRCSSDWTDSFRNAYAELRALDGQERRKIHKGISRNHALGATRRKPVHRAPKGSSKIRPMTDLHGLFGVKSIRQLLHLKTGISA